MQILSSALILTSLAILFVELVYGQEAIPSPVLVAFAVYGALTVTVLATLKFMMMVGRIPTPIGTNWKDGGLMILSTAALVIFLLVVFR